MGAFAGLALTWVVGGGDMGLFRMVVTALGLELGGGEARGGWKGEGADGLGWTGGCWIGGLVF